MFGVRSRRHRLQPTLKILPAETPSLKLFPCRDLDRTAPSQSFLHPKQPRAPHFPGR